MGGTWGRAEEASCLVMDAGGEKQDTMPIGGTFLPTSQQCHHLGLLFCKIGLELDQDSSTFLGGRTSRGCGVCDRAPKEGKAGIWFHYFKLNLQRAV